jgi:hypothetical protein
MKIEKERPGFTPVKITFETERELNDFMATLSENEYMRRRNRSYYPDPEESSFAMKLYNKIKEVVCRS